MCLLKITFQVNTSAYRRLQAACRHRCRTAAVQHCSSPQSAAVEILLESMPRAGQSNSPAATSLNTHFS